MRTASAISTSPIAAKLAFASTARYRLRWQTGNLPRRGLIKTSFGISLRRKLTFFFLHIGAMGCERWDTEAIGRLVPTAFALLACCCAVRCTLYAMLRLCLLAFVTRSSVPLLPPLQSWIGYNILLLNSSIGDVIIQSEPQTSRYTELHYTHHYPYRSCFPAATKSSCTSMPTWT